MSKDNKKKIPLILLKRNDAVLEACETRFNHYFDCSLYELRDLSGNLVLPSMNDERDKLFSIDYIDGENIFISLVSRDNQNSLLHYRFDDKQSSVRLINQLKSQNRSCETPRITVYEGRNVGILEEFCGWGTESVSSLYSLKDGEVISPKFSTLSLIESDDEIAKFLFNDTIKSESGELTTVLIGAINEKCQMTDFVYDDYFSTVHTGELNTHPNFMQYNALKRAVQRKLNDEEDQIKEINSAKKKIKNNFINKIKNQ